MSFVTTKHIYASFKDTGNPPTASPIRPIAKPPLSRRIVTTSGVLIGVKFINCPRIALGKGVQVEYESFAKELIEGLRGVIELEMTGSEERVVRRKADPQKERIKTFIRKWTTEPSVNTSPSFKKISFALRELGAFYIKNGERATLTQEVAERILEALKSAESNLSS